MDQEKDTAAREHSGLIAYWEFCYPSSRGNDPLFPTTPEIPQFSSASQSSIATHRKNLGNFAEMGEYREALFAALGLLQDPPAISSATISKMAEELEALRTLHPEQEPTTAAFLAASGALSEYWEMRSEALLILGSVARREGEESAASEESLAYAWRHSAAHRDEFLAARLKLLDAVPVFLSAVATLLEHLGNPSGLPLWRVKLLQRMVDLHLEHRDELKTLVSKLADRIYGQ